MLSRAATSYDEAFAAGLRPEPRLTVSEWADRKRFLSSGASAEPGLWRTARTPYLRDIMDALSPSSSVERVVFMKGAQIGATEAGNNWLGYIIDQAPGPAMLVMPTSETAVRVSKQRLAPLIEDSPCLRGKVRNPSRRESGNTLMSKEFPGGILILTGANSAVGLRSMPVRFLFADELDGYPHDAAGEGDPLDLAIKRTATFARRKIFMVSTPTLAGSSRIEAAFEESDQRRYWVPCPDCGEYQVLEWDQVKWPKGQPEKAEYACQHCGTLIPEHGKTAMLEAGEWRAESEGDGRTIGFHLSALYSPFGWYSWSQAAIDFIKAKGSPERLQSWVNTVLGKPWTEQGDAPEWQRLYDRREDYRPGTVPMGALYLTAGADVQRDRIEVEVVGWGPDRESWSVDYRVLNGDPYQQQIWQDLDELLAEEFRHEAGGTLKVDRLAIDSGYLTHQVYLFAHRHFASKVMAIKGQDGMTGLVGSPSSGEINRGGKKMRQGARVWPINVSSLKATLYGRLKLEPARGDDAQTFPPGYCHFPGYSAEFFRQITAEKLVERKDRKGFLKREWIKTRHRNEALDCRIYAMAAAIVSGVERWPEGRWEEARRIAGVRTDTATCTVPSYRDLACGTVIRSQWLEC